MCVYTQIYSPLLHRHKYINIYAHKYINGLSRLSININEQPWASTELLSGWHLAILLHPVHKLKERQTRAPKGAANRGCLSLLTAVTTEDLLTSKP